MITFSCDHCGHCEKHEQIVRSHYKFNNKFETLIPQLETYKVKDLCKSCFQLVSHYRETLKREGEVEIFKKCKEYIERGLK